MAVVTANFKFFFQTDINYTNKHEIINKYPWIRDSKGTQTYICKPQCKMNTIIFIHSTEQVPFNNNCDSI